MSDQKVYTHAEMVVLCDEARGQYNAEYARAEKAEARLNLEQRRLDWLINRDSDMHRTAIDKCMAESDA